MIRTWNSRSYRLKLIGEAFLYCAFVCGATAITHCKLNRALAQADTGSLAVANCSHRFTNRALRNICTPHMAVTRGNFDGLSPATLAHRGRSHRHHCPRAELQS